MTLYHPNSVGDLKEWRKLGLPGGAGKDTPGRSKMFTVVSAATKEYNCIAWAAGESDRFWWPDSMGVGYWPEGIPRQESVGAFVEAYRTIGYEVCHDSQLESGFDKVAIYTDGTGKPTHAARLLREGRWTSKLGKSVDIEHDKLLGDFPPGCAYGQATIFLRRPRDAA